MEHDILYKKRHSLSHLMASAVLSFFPDTKLAIGPAIDNGFYYDFDFSAPITDKDLGKIEQKMRELLKKWGGFEGKEISEDEARKLFADNPYKLELIDGIVKNPDASARKITVYTSGDFTDLCAGGHVDNVKEIESGSFKLDRIAGAYWRGDEKNKMLTRIYGLAFDTKADLEKYQADQIEAEKRDHRKLGKELDLFVFSDVVGKGLPLFTEKGATIRRELERFIVDEEIRRGYKHVCTPDLAKIDLYKKSGHYPYYKDSMYAPIKIDEEEFMLRPMSCPHHFELYLSKPRTYKELPMRIGELVKLYRYEQSGELNGLVRLRGFCLADAHIICADSTQAADEVNGALDLIDYILQIFKLELGKNYWYRLSLGDRGDDKKYFKDDNAWDEAEEKLRLVLKARTSHYVEASGEAAFYGPKIDIQMKNVRGKEDTAFTVQYDFVMPQRFKLNYIDRDGKEKQGIVVHRSSIGCIERVMAFLIEHYAGNFPVWLSPTQIKIIPVRENHNEYAKKVADELRSLDIRVDLDTTDEGMGKKIRAGKNMRVPYMLVLGDKEIESGELALEIRDGARQEKISLENLKTRLQKEIKERV
jgi:threonyl-tRNA synthetase